MELVVARARTASSVRIFTGTSPVRRGSRARAAALAITGTTSGGMEVWTLMPTYPRLAYRSTAFFASSAVCAVTAVGAAPSPRPSRKPALSTCGPMAVPSS